jgi:hypothetical protein
LHWGNVLVQRQDISLESRLSDLTLHPVASSQAGIRVTIIDFTLSRVGKEGEVTWGGLDDASLFEGEGKEKKTFIFTYLY